MLNLFLKENEKLGLQKTVNKDGENLIELLKEKFESFSKEEKVFYKQMSDKVIDSYDFQESEIKELLCIRNKYFYTSKPKEIVDETTERDMVFEDFKDIFMFHIKYMMSTVGILYRKDKTFLNKSEYEILSSFATKVKAEDFDLFQLSFVEIQTFINLVKDKNIEKQIEDKHLLKMVDIIRNSFNTAFDINQIKEENYIKILELRNKNITFLS